jgi:tetratricopeptide (TPR) repeat protein
MQTSVHTFQKAASIVLMWSALASAIFPLPVSAQNYGMPSGVPAVNYGTPLALNVDEYTKVSKLVSAKQLNEALVKADEYLASKPKDPQMRFIKGVVLTEMGQSADAMRLFTTLTQDYPELPEPYNNLAVLYAADDQFEQARIALEMAIRTNPSYATAHENMGDVYLKLASQSYSKALQLEPNKTTVQPKLALIRTLFGTVAKP